MERARSWVPIGVLARHGLVAWPLGMLLVSIGACDGLPAATRGSELRCTVTPVDRTLPTSPPQDCIALPELSHQGFFDVFVDADHPEPLGDLCLALRVEGVRAPGTDPEAETIAFASERICSSLYGNHSDAIAFVAPCNADLELNRVTVWVLDVTTDAQWHNPCPAPADAGADPTTWSGGCSLSASCFENVDTPVDLGLDLQVQAR